MIFPKSISSDMTLFNRYGRDKFQTSVIKGVFWNAGYGTKLLERGTASTPISADAVSVLILKNTIAEGKTYIAPESFKKLLPDEVELYWTLAKGDKFFKGLADTSVDSFDLLEKTLGQNLVMTITKINNNDFGPDDMRHFKIIGK